MPANRKIRSVDPWADFICSFELSVERDAVASPLSTLLALCSGGEFELEKLQGVHPALLYASTWREFWSSVDYLNGQIDNYSSAVDAGGQQQEQAFREMSIAVRNWLFGVARHIELLKKICNSCVKSAPQRKNLISTQLHALWNPISRATGAIKHGAADVCPIHYSSPQSGDVSGFFVAAHLDAMTRGPSADVHPNRGAWSFNRVVPVVISGVFSADRIAADMLRRFGVQPCLSEPLCSVVGAPISVLARIARHARWVFPDERNLPFARLRRTRNGFEFLVGRQHGYRPQYPNGVHWHLLVGHVEKGYTYQLPYWQKFEPDLRLG